MKKKVLIVLLSALLAFSAFVPLTGAQAASFDPDAQRVINFVKTFSFMNELTVEEMQNKTPLTRAQLATIVSRILVGGENEIPVGEIPFTDVPEWARPQVYFVYNQGIMVGDDEGRFLPDEMVSYGQAAKVFVHLLGYDAQALKRGGYPSGYIYTASQLGLLDGIDANAYSAISRYDIAKILYQAIGVEVLKIYAVSEKGADLATDGRDYLSVYLGIETREGILGAINGKSAVKGVQCGKGKAAFGKTIASVADARYDALLGSRVRYFLKSELEEYELVYLEEHKKNVVTRVKSQDVLKNDSDFSMTHFVYNEYEDVKESVEIVNEFCYSYNGTYDFDFDWGTCAFDTGYVDLIDHDENGIIDVVMVWNFDEIVVNSISGKTIAGIHLDRLDLSSYRDNVTITFPDGSMGSVERLSELKMWDVVSIVRSKDNKSVNLIVCRDGITGVVEEKSTTDARAFIIDGKEYFISKKFQHNIDMGSTENLQLGRSGEYFFNIIGEIAGIRAKKSDTELQYGYLLGIKEPKGLKTEVGMLIIETSGKQSELYTTDKIYFTDKNGVRDRDEAKVAILGNDLCPAGRFEPQLIRYRLDKDGKVAEVECAREPSTAMCDKDNFSLDYENAASEFFYNDHAYGFCESGNLATEFFAAGTTIIYYIPVENGSIVKEDAKTISTNYFRNGVKYKNIRFYDNDETMVPSVIVYQPNIVEVAETFKESDSLVIVDKLVKAVNAKDEVVSMLKCYTGGSYQRLEIINNSNIELNYGDIIFPKYNNDGVLFIDSNSVIFRNDGRQPYYWKANHMSANSNGFSECWSTHGFIYRKTETNMSVYCGGDGFAAISLGRNKPLVYIISKNGKVRIGSVDDLVPSSALRQTDGTIIGDPYDGSKVLLNTRIDYVREIFIFED